jgi:hypothetical protein
MFDYVIKEKAEMIDSQKVFNNDKMDELIEQLGYMDYRDALACNKYILEAKRSRDYYQIARSKVLEYAMRTLSNRRREKIETESRKQVDAESNPEISMEARREMREQAKLNILMKEEPSLAEKF